MYFGGGRLGGEGKYEKAKEEEKRGVTRLEGKEWDLMGGDVTWKGRETDFHWEQVHRFQREA